MYIKITNESDLVPRLYLELLGVSTKRNNNNTIGQFGSGSKFAPIFALRKGWEWVNVGFDSEGGYTMRYDVDYDNRNDIEIVRFVYENADGAPYVKNSSYSLGAGELGWDHPFQVFREAFANALDAHYEFGAEYSISHTDEIGPPVEGEFSVYLSAEDDLMEIVENFDKFFSLNRKELLAGWSGNRVLKKLDDELGGPVRIYHKGILVYGPELSVVECGSAFDYELSHVDLNEERNLNDVSTTEIYHIARTIARNTKYADDSDGVGPLVDYMLDHNLIGCTSYGDDIWEYGYQYAFDISTFDSLVDVDSSNSFGKEFVKRAELKYCNDKYDRVGFVVEKVLSINDISESLKERGVRAIPVSLALYNLLASTGAKENLDRTILGEQFDTPFVELEGDDAEFFNFAYRCVADYDPSLCNVPVRIMETNDNNRHICGKTLNLFDDNRPTLIVISQILIEKRNMQQLIATIIHELDHVASKAVDNTREFRDAADIRLGDLILKHYADKINLAELINKSVR